MATTTGDYVREVPMSDPYWSAHFAGAGRPPYGDASMIGGRGPMVALVGMAGLLLVLAIISGWRGASRLTSRSDDTKAVEQAATAFVEAYGTFDFRDPESYQERPARAHDRPRPLGGARR